MFPPKKKQKTQNRWRRSRKLRSKSSVYQARRRFLAEEARRASSSKGRLHVERAAARCHVCIGRCGDAPGPPSRSLGETQRWGVANGEQRQLRRVRLRLVCRRTSTSVSRRSCSAETSRRLADCSRLSNHRSQWDGRLRPGPLHRHVPLC